MAGVKELSDVLKFVCATASAVAEAAKDGKVSLGDATALVPLLYKLPSAVDGWDKLPGEVADLDDAELQDLLLLVKQELDLPNDKLEEAAEEALGIALQLYALVKKLQA